MPNLSFYARLEVCFLSVFGSSIYSSEKLRDHTESVVNQIMRVSNRPDVQSQHPGAGNFIQEPGGGMGPRQGPLPGQNMGPGHGGFQYK